jgi:hypothetical protein
VEQGGGIAGPRTGGVVESYKKFDYRKLSFDATRILFMTCTLELPWRRQFSGLERAVGKWWSVSTLMHYHKGSPGTATDSVAVGGDPDVGTASGGRPNIVSGQPIEFKGTCSNGHATGWVNRAAFAPESALGAGDARQQRHRPRLLPRGSVVKNIQFAREGKVWACNPGGCL